MFRLPSVVFIFTKVASVACFCNITYNSSDVVVTCNTFFNASVIPKNVTVLNCHVNKVVCNPSVFCNRDFEKMRAINISHNNLENIPMGCFSSFSNLEWLTISNNAKLGLHNLFHAAYGIDRTKIKHIFASNINRVQVTIPFPRNISTLLTKTSLQTFHIAYNDIKTMEQGGIYFWPRTLLELSVRGNRFDLDYYMLEIVNLNKLRKLDFSEQCSTRRYFYGIRRHTYLEIDMNNKTGHYCKDITVGYLVHVTSLSLKTLIATGMVWGTPCIPRLNIANHSQLEHIDFSRGEYYEWIGPIDVNPQFNSIKTFDLSHSQCRFIKNGFFKNLTQLTTLNISYNLLGPFMATNEAKKVFQGLKSLKYLKMTNNFINHLHKNLLKDSMF